ncbi:MAG: hypothetical protein NTU73_05855 [Ignavibacteriae bacterium]|nr:hypothetical protein [Ignavibacteriota bacterium]
MESGDYVFLYTKNGNNDDYDNKAKTKTHRFYWNISRAIWNDTGDCADYLK